LWAVPYVRPAVVLAEHDVANPVQAVLNAPMADPVRQDCGGGGPRSWQTGDRIGDLDRGLFATGSRALESADLL